MALSNPRVFFGVQNVTPYNRTTAEDYGIIKVIGAFKLNLTSELVDLHGGSQKFPWASQQNIYSGEVTFTASQFESFMFQLFLGKTPTDNAAEANGSIATALTNVYGTSCKSATIGVASVTVLTGSEANLKFGRYVLKANSATKVDIYMSTDVDFGRGTAGSFSSDLLKIASDQTITTGADVNVTAYGFKMTGGSGTIGMTVGDTAIFDVRPQNTKSSVVVVGGAAYQTLPEIGLLAYSQKTPDGVIVEIDVYRAIASGMPHGFESFKFAETEIKMRMLYDAAKDGAFQETYIDSV